MSFDGINEALGIEDEESKKIIIHPDRVKTPVPYTDEELVNLVRTNKRQDYSFSHESIKHVIKETEELIIEAADNTRSSPTARNLESFATLIKTFAELHSSLLNLTETMSKGSQPQHQAVTTTNNNILITSSEELIDRIRNSSTPGI